MFADFSTRAGAVTSAKGALSSESKSKTLLFCFSHLRWDFVFQRPQQLMSRLAGSFDVVFWEEPTFDGAAPSLNIRQSNGVAIVTPSIPEGAGERTQQMLKALLDEFLAARKWAKLVRWYYTPMMLSFSSHLSAECTVYDCMDELANFKFAPEALKACEEQLFKAADIVFTGGKSLYEAKRSRHSNIHAFPSSVDLAHFSISRNLIDEPTDQLGLAKPRIGFYGVIDERLDLELIAALAEAKPDCSIVMVGPVVKIDPLSLPQAPNIHYLGPKSYADLPAYLAGWNVAMMPFALNDATRFISPTKTPEYLAGGKPVVSTPIQDVVRDYGDLEAVKVGVGQAFIDRCNDALSLDPAGGAWLEAVDRSLETQSWDNTCAKMHALIRQAVARKERTAVRLRPPTLATSYDYLIVGAGFAGSVMAERLARGSGKKVLVIDKRSHVGGNAYDKTDAAGLLMHVYGPHIFHTNSEQIFSYLSNFTKWRPYEHKVLAMAGGRLAPMPINRTTLNTLYNANLNTEAEAAAFLAARAEKPASIRTSEDVVLSQVGRELYELFFRGYTRKQWGLDPSELDKSVISRVPTRFCTDDRYFTDRYQFMPAAGYTRMFENMLNHPLIDVELDVNFAEIRHQRLYDKLIYTGPIDEYFDYEFGPLPYRSLRFQHETLDQEWLQPVGVINYPAEDIPYTRVTEYKHLTGQRHDRTTITREYPSATGDPYYPIPRPENQTLYKRYEALAALAPDVAFVGRLATYRYYNMDQVVGQALAMYKRMMRQEETRHPVAQAELDA